MAAAALAAIALAVLPAQSTEPSSLEGPPGRLRAAGRVFRHPDGSPFAWRGLTAFRLAEMVAGGRAGAADDLLAWAASRGVTVVRVLAMAAVPFELSPESGRAALPGLLQMAGRRGLVVEVVALADSGVMAVDVDEQVRSIGAICARHPNCVLEIANEPWHATQRAGLENASTLRRLRSLVPDDVPVSFGAPSTDDDTQFSGGDYLTVHLDRADGDGGWRHVLRMLAAERLGAAAGKPVVDDEPIGAGEQFEPGRREPDPTRWFARGVLARALRLGSTFHFEGGVRGMVPAGREAECFDAWRRGLDALPEGLEHRASLSEPGTPGAAVASFDRGSARALVLLQEKRSAWAVAVGVAEAPGVTWAGGWRQTGAVNFGGTAVVRAARRSP